MLTEEQREQILYECSIYLGLDPNVHTMQRKADAHTPAEKDMVRVAYRKGMTYKKSFLWLHNVDICFFFDSGGKACCTFSSCWRFGCTDLTSDKLDEGLHLIRAMLSLMTTKYNYEVSDAEKAKEIPS